MRRLPWAPRAPPPHSGRPTDEVRPTEPPERVVPFDVELMLERMDGEGGGSAPTESPGRDLRIEKAATRR